MRCGRRRYEGREALLGEAPLPQSDRGVLCTRRDASQGPEREARLPLQPLSRLAHDNEPTQMAREPVADGTRMIRRDVTERGLKALEERGASDELLAAARHARDAHLFGPRFWLVVLRVACAIGSRRMQSWAALRLWDAS